MPNCFPWESIHLTCWADIELLILGPSLVEKLDFESFILISPIIVVIKYTFWKNFQTKSGGLDSSLISSRKSLNILNSWLFDPSLRIATVLLSFSFSPTIKIIGQPFSECSRILYPIFSFLRSILHLILLFSNSFVNLKAY